VPEGCRCPPDVRGYGPASEEERPHVRRHNGSHGSYRDKQVQGTNVVLVIVRVLQKAEHAAEEELADDVESIPAPSGSASGGQEPDGLEPHHCTHSAMSTASFAAARSRSLFTSMLTHVSMPSSSRTTFGMQ
jgi:hypothetical protein